jgi:hypothetical protein
MTLKNEASMYREGLDPEFWAWVVNIAGLVFGFFLGARAFFDPRWAARLVRLKPDDEKPGGFAEFRATYGGLFAATHGLAAMLSVHWVLVGAFVTGSYAAGAALVLGAGWIGTAAGRLLSMIRDKAGTGFNKISCAVEFGTGVMIIAPWAFWSFA